MNEITIDVQGMTKLLGRFKQHKAGIVLQADNIVGMLGDNIVEVAKDLVATDTEKTKDSIRKEVRDGDLVIVVEDRKSVV